jgi:HEAT repeat protein
MHGLLPAGIGCALLLCAGAGRTEEPARTIPFLLKQLRTGDAAARQDAAEALGDLGPAAEEAVPALAALLGGDPLVVRPAARALARIGPRGVAALLEAAPSSDSHRDALAGALASAGPAALPQLTRALRGPDRGVRTIAARALGRMGPRAERAAPDLLWALKDRELRAGVGFELVDWRLPCVQAARLPVLRFGDQAEPRREAARALSRMGPAGAAALAEALRRDPWRLHGPSVRRLPGAVRGVLADYLEDRRPHDLAGALVLLVRCGELKERLEENDALTRGEAARALAEMGGEARRALPALVEAVEDPDDRVSRFACEALVALGPEARAALPALTREIRLKVCSTPVINALRAIGPEGEEVLSRDCAPALIERLEQAPENQEGACVALPQLGRAGRSAAAALEALVESKEELENPFWPLWALAEVSPDPAPALTKGLAHPRAQVRLHAAGALGRLGPRAAAAVPRLRTALCDDADGEVRSAVVDALRDIVAEPADLTPLLIEELKRQPIRKTPGGPRCDDAGRRAARQLGALGSEAGAAIAALRALRKRLDPKDRDAALAVASALVRIDGRDEEALGEIGLRLTGRSATPEETAEVQEAALAEAAGLGGRARALAPAVHRLLDADDELTRLEAARTLARIDPERAGDALPVLLELFQGDWASQALEVLSELGPAARDAAPEVAALLQQHDLPDYDGQWVHKALATMGPAGSAAVPVLRERLREGRGAGVRLSIAALGQIGPEAAPATPELRTLLHSVRADHRAAAARALGRIGPAARAALPRLGDLLEEDDDGCQAWAAFAAARITGDARPYLPRLVEAALREQGATTALVGEQRATAALAELGREARPALPAVLAALREGDAPTRAQAVRILTQLGPDAADAVPTLTRLLDDRRPELRAAAAESLAGLGPAARPAHARLRQLLTDPDGSVVSASAEALRRARSESCPEPFQLRGRRYTLRVNLD